MQLRHRLGVEAQHKALSEQQASFDGIGPEPNRLSTIGKLLKLSDGLLLADAMVSLEMLAVEGDAEAICKPQAPGWPAQTVDPTPPALQDLEEASTTQLVKP